MNTLFKSIKLKKDKHKHGNIINGLVRAYDCNVGILILGLQESGKTTLQRQLDVAYGMEDFDPKYFQRLIYGNTLATLIRLIENSERLNIDIREDNLTRVKRVMGTPIELARNRLPRFPLQLSYDCKCLWEDNGIQNAFVHSNKCFSFKTPGRTKYYMENMFRVFAPDFIPNELDIISAYDQVDSVQRSSILHRRTKLDITCPPSKYIVSNNWNGMVQYQPHYLFYVVSLKDFQLELVCGEVEKEKEKEKEATLSCCHKVSNHKNQLLESLKTFESLIQSEVADSSYSIFLIFNIGENLDDIIKSLDLKSWFSDYDIDPLQLDSTQKSLHFIIQKFTKCLIERNRPYKTNIVNLLDKTSTKSQFETMLDFIIPDAEKRGLVNDIVIPSSSSQNGYPSSILPHTSSIVVTPIQNDNHIEITNNSTSTTTTSTTSSPIFPSTTSSLASTSTNINNNINNNNSIESPQVKKPNKKEQKEKEKELKEREKERERENKELKEKEKEKEKELKGKEKEREKERDREQKEKEQKEKEKKAQQKKKKGKGLAGVQSGFNSIQGRRKNMEDTHAIFDKLVEDTTPYLNGLCSYYAVYDGHGGTETSKALEPIVHTCVTSTPSFLEGNFEQALKDGFEIADKQVLSICEKSGSTGVACILANNHLYTANIGDSELVLARCTGVSNKVPTYESVLLTYKHLANDEKEKQRITEMGGMIIFGRLFGSLAVSRSFGDREYKEGEKKFVTCDPYTTVTELTSKDHFLILACDGLWDKVSYDEAVAMTAKLIKQGKSATEISDALVQDSYEKGSVDNITVLVVILNYS